MARKHIWGNTLSYNGSVMAHRLGIVRTEFDATDDVYKSYVFVNTASDTTVYDGVVLGFIQGGTTVTVDADDTCPNNPAGVGIGKIDPNSYGWIQIAGIHQSIFFVDAGVHKQDSVVMSTTDGAATTIAIGSAPSHKTLGVITHDGSTNCTLNVNYQVHI